MSLSENTSDNGSERQKKGLPAPVVVRAALIFLCFGVALVQIIKLIKG